MTEEKKAKKIKKADPKKEAMKLSIAELREVMILKLNEEIQKLDESDNTKSILLSYLTRILKF